MYKKLTTLLLLLLIAAPCSFGGQRDPRGEVFTGYYLSELDDTKQPYSVWLPPDYDPKQKWPLVIFLHGLGGSHKMGRPRREIEDCIVIAADGRGNTDYKLWGELDVIRVVQEARQRYTIDPDRVWMFGISMGGSGSWQIGVHFPDIFAALGPVCGNADHRAWERLWGWGEKTPTWMSPKKKFIESTESAAFFAENLVNLPSWPIHGDKDNVVPVGHSRSMAAELKKVGAECHYDEVPGAGHGVPGDRIALMLEWMKTQKRNPWPRRVVFKTAWRRHPGAYWVRIHRFQRAFAYARVEAEALEGNTFRVKTANVQEFALHLVPPLAAKGKPVTVQADGKTWTGPVPADGWVRLRLQGDAWAPSAEPKTLHKTPDLEGPVQHAFMGSFMIVHGTQGDDEQAKKVSREEARILADRWNRWARGKCRTKADKDVKPEDIKKHNLILVGDPATNSLVPRVMEGLPIRVEGNAIVFGAQRFEGDDLGMKVVYPNPLNPKRYVALFTGTTWRGVYQIVGRFGNWFDWGILDGWHWQDFAVFDDQSYSPETFLAVGFFDNDWKLDPGWYVTGNQEMRLARPKRTTPVYAAAPDSGSIYLSELIPAHARNEKGCTGRDRSFNAHPLTLGGKTYERGLGIHPNCDLAFDLGGRFPTFEAVVGTDLEGEDSVAEARAKAETIEFMVIGDGKMIFQTGRMKWDSEPRHIYVPIPGVRRLELKLHRRSGPRWLSGPADWAIARVGEPIHNRIAVRDDAAAADPISLDGEWELAGFEAGAGIGSQAHYGHAEARADAVKVTVPGSVYAAADPAEAESKEWWHWREFDIPADWAGKAVWIEMDGAAYQADAWLNGRWIGRTVGPFIPGRFNATLGAKLGKRNVLAVRTIASPAPWAKGDGPFQPLPASKLVTSTALARLGMLPLGIWRPVRVSATGPVRPSDPSVEPAGGSVSIDPSAKHLLVNGKPVDIRACMWAPSDALLRPDPARVERLLAHAKKCGFNALFVQDGAFEADGLYDLCDKAGILVLQGLPRAGQGVDVEVYLANAEAMIRRLRGRASIVAWCVDGANRHLAARAVALCSAVDPNRLIADGPTEGEMRLWSTQIDPKTNVVHWRSMPLPCAGDVASPPTRASLGGEDLPWPASGIWPGDGPPSLAAAAYGPAPSAWRHILSGQAAQAAALQRALERARLTGGSSVVQQLNEPAPSSSAALVDYRGIPKPAYYAALRARAATAIFLDAGAETPATLTVGAPLKGAVCVQSATPLKGARVRAELFDTQMRPLGDWNAMVDLEANAVARPLAVDWTPKLEQAGDVVFLHLALSDADGKPIVSDLVWLGIEAAQPATAKLRVAWLGAEPRGVLADKAFLAAAGIALVTPDDEMLDPADDARKPFEGIDVIVVDAATALDDYLDADMRSVAAAVRRGCGLLALGQSHVLHDSALGLLLPTDRPADKVTGQAQQPTAAVPTHPVLGRIAFGNCPDLAARAASTATADAMVLAQFDPEHPLLVERSEGQGRVLALLTRPGELAGWGDGRRLYAGLLAYLARLGYADLSRLVDAATPAPLRALGTLKPATVEATLRKHENGAMVVLKNTSDTLAFLLVLEAEGEGAGAVHFSDNGFWLMPGKSAGVIVSTPNGKRNYKLTLQGWNTPRTPIR